MRLKLTFIFIICAILASGFGCDNRNQRPSISSSDKNTPNEVIKGIFKLEDAHGPQIDEVLLDHTYVDAHKDDLQKLAEKEVEAKGTVITHYCLPEEECLMSGYIKHLEDILYIKASVK